MGFLFLLIGGNLEGDSSNEKELWEKGRKYFQATLLAEGRVWFVQRACTGHQNVAQSHTGAGLVGEVGGDLDRGKYGAVHFPL